MRCSQSQQDVGFSPGRRNCADIGTNSKRTLYLSFVRSDLGYASEVWAPQTTVHHLRILEGVQRRATRFILNCSYKVWERPDYKSRLKMLKLLPFVIGTNFEISASSISVCISTTILMLMNIPI